MVYGLLWPSTRESAMGPKARSHTDTFLNNVERGLQEFEIIFATAKERDIRLKAIPGK
jgi:hypothetical protein